MVDEKASQTVPTMKILILNHAFYPDHVSTAQHATDLAIALADAGHEVTVLCSRHGYDDPGQIFPKRETWKTIEILRLPSTSFGKSKRWRRALDFAALIAACSARLLFLPRFDVILSLTSPPLISFIAALAVPLKAHRLVIWSMDLNPDEAIAAGWLRENSLAARLLSWMLRYSLRRADRIIVMDRFMKERLVHKGADEAKVSVVPPWSHDDQVRFDPQGRENFRSRHHLTEKFVVMYSGNHSPCHPLDTLLEAADRLSGDRDIVFCFVGGGSEFPKVKDRAQKMANVLCLPYQPIAELSASLSAADLHVVVMGNEFVGIVHPCKVYNILAVGKPFLYIGPKESHIIDIMDGNAGANLGYACEHGDVKGVLSAIGHGRVEAEAKSETTIGDRFSLRAQLPRMANVITAESANTSHDE